MGRRADAPVDEEVAEDEGPSGLRMSLIPKSIVINNVLKYDDECDTNWV